MRYFSETVTEHAKFKEASRLTAEQSLRRPQAYAGVLLNTMILPGPMSCGVALKLSYCFCPYAITFFSHFVHVRSIVCVLYFLSLTDMYHYIYFCTYYRIFFMGDELFGCGIYLSLTAMCYHILFVHTIKFFFMCGQLFVCEILLSSADMCYRIFCVYFVFFSSCAITFFVCMHHNIEQICLCGNVLHFY